MESYGACVIVWIHGSTYNIYNIRIPRHHDKETLMRSVFRTLSLSQLVNLWLLTITIKETRESFHLQFSDPDEKKNDKAAENDAIRARFIAHLIKLGNISRAPTR